MMIASNSSVYNPTCISNVGRHVGWCCILNNFILSSLPCFPAADLLSLHFVTFLKVFFNSCVSKCYRGVPWCGIDSFHYKLPHFTTALARCHEREEENSKGPVSSRGRGLEEG